MSQVAFVTGAGTGIGRGIALGLAKKGYDVALHCRGSLQGAEKTAEEIRSLGRSAIVLQADLTKVSEIQRMFSEFSKKFDRLDLFVNNAGLTIKNRFLDTTEEEFDTLCNLDYKGAFFCMQCAAKLMVEKQIQGSIIVISSNNAYAHFADVSVYGSIKTAVKKLAEHMAVELAQYRIRVNVVAPGWTDTGASRLDDKEGTYYKVPLQKWATVEEIADAVVYLASPSACSITGSTLVIDNGALMVSDRASRYGYHE